MKSYSLYVCAGMAASFLALSNGYAEVVYDAMGNSTGYDDVATQATQASSGLATSAAASGAGYTSMYDVTAAQKDRDASPGAAAAAGRDETANARDADLAPDAYKSADEVADAQNAEDKTKACSPKAGATNSEKFDHNLPGDVRGTAMCNGALDEYYAACNANDKAGAAKALNKLDKAKDPSAANNGSDGTCILLRSADVATATPISKGSGASLGGADAAAVPDFIGPRTVEQAAAEAKLNTANFGGADEAVAETAAAETKAADFIGPRTQAQAAVEQAQAAATLQDSNAAVGNTSLGSRLTATQLLEEGKWPTTLKERQALMAQYLKEKGLPDEVTKAMLMTAYKENTGMDPNRCTTLGTSACGLFQYVDGTWKQNGGTAATRFDAKTQIDIAAKNFMSRYDQYQAGTLKCGSGQTSYYNCNAVYHQAGSFTPKAYSEGWVQGAIDTTNKTMAAATQYANQALSMIGIDVSSLTTTQQTGLGATVAQTLGYTGNTSNGYAGDFSIGSGTTGTTNSGGIGGLVASFLGNQLNVPGLTNNSVITQVFTSQLMGQLFGSSSSGSGSSGSSGSNGGSSYYAGTDGATVVTSTGSVRGYELAKACGANLPSSSDAVMLMIQACQSVRAAG